MRTRAQVSFTSRLNDLMTIGELAERTGVARSALRYYEELGLLTPDGREWGQRRYSESAVAATGVILLLREVGFSLREIGQVVQGGSASPGAASWRALAAGKIDDLSERIAKAEAARSALEHALAHHDDDDVLDCPSFLEFVTARLEGSALRASHPH